jgi:CheY-like chemotaxis protein
MALGALIGAYQEDEAGGLYALQPLAGRTLIEYQARCAAAAGCAPIVVVVETVPVALAAAFDRLRGEGIQVVPVSDGQEAAARFEPQARVLQMADGIAPAMSLVERVTSADERTVVTVPDDDAHQLFERIDNHQRWAGLALVDGQTLASTAAMLGDWDLLSTLLRRTIQAGANHVRTSEGVTPYHAQSGGDAAAFDRRLLLASRQSRPDWVSRFLLPIPEEFATEQLMRSPVQPSWLMTAALVLTVGAVVAIWLAWPWAGLGLLLVSLPLDLIADRLAQLRLQPLPARALTRRMLSPAAGAALVSLGWLSFQHGHGWGPLMGAATTIAFAEALRVERSGRDLPFSHWLFDRRPAVVVASLIAALGWWTVVPVVLAVYAGASFFLVQHLVHRPAYD